MMMKYLAKYLMTSIFIMSFSLLFAQETPKLTLPQAPEVRVHAHNSQNVRLREGLAFVWDDHTVVAGYKTVHGASWINVQVDGQNMVAGELVSWSQEFDLAFLRTKEELPEGRLLGSSDTLASGDPAYLFAQDHGAWKLKETRLKKWEDSGHGFVWLQLTDFKSSDASPLFNRAGKIVGWFPGKSPAIPLKAVFNQLAEKSLPVSLSDFTASEKFWNVVRIPSRSEVKKGIEHGAVKKITGPSGSPFEIQIPKTWEHRTSQQPGQFLLIAVSSQFGISLAFRTVPPQTGDLNIETERAGTLLFPGIPRQEMVPTTAGGLSGLQAQYEDGKGFVSTVFYGLTSTRLYVLSITYPSKFSEEMDPILEKLFASLRFPNK